MAQKVDFWKSHTKKQFRLITYEEEEEFIMLIRLSLYERGKCYKITHHKNSL